MMNKCYRCDRPSSSSEGGVYTEDGYYLCDICCNESMKEMNWGELTND